MIDNIMTMNDSWIEYKIMTDEEYNDYLEYLDNEYEQANNY